MPGRKKLYMVGIDSAPLWMVRELSKERGMEAFKSLLDAGLMADMESTMPPMTGPAWPSIYTGLQPSEHGVPDFFVMKKDYAPDIVYYDSRKVPPFWRDLAEAGKECLVITPATDIELPDYGNVDMITGFPLPSKTNSKALKGLMEKYGFKGEPDIEKDMREGKVSLKEASEQYVESAHARASIAKDAMESKGYDFVFVCFTETDRMGHFSTNAKEWKDYALPIYREISSFLGMLMEKADKEGSELIIVSDHGMQPIRNKFLLNAWLAREGYVHTKEEIGGAEEKGVAGQGRQLMYQLRERIVKTRARKIYDALPTAAKKVVFKGFGAFGKGMKGDYVRLHLSDFDMTRTTAFAAISNDPVACIWINDSRFDEGIVQDKDREKAKRELMERLKTAKSAEGDPMFVNVFDADQYYGKTDRFIAPDILVEAKQGYTVDIFYFSSGTLFMPPELAKSGDHLREGIFACYPKSTKPDNKTFSVIDIAKIVYSYFK